MAKKLAREDADIVEFVGDLCHQRARLVLLVEHGLRRGQRRGGKDAAFVDIDGRVPETDLAIDAAYQQYRKFMVEVDEAFEHRGVAVDGIPCGVGVGGGHDPRLSLAVIAHAHGLEDRGRADPVEGRIERGAVGHRGERCGAAAEPGDEILFGQPVLRDFEPGGTGANRDMAREEAHRVDRHIFEFIGDDVAMRREGGEARFVVPRGLDMMRGDVGRDTFTIRRIDMDFVTELRRRLAEHAPKLAAAQNADR